MVACSQKPQLTTSQAAQPQQSQAGHNAIISVGKIVSVNPADHAAVIDHEAIPGFMGAMTMSYPIAPLGRFIKTGCRAMRSPRIVVARGDGFHSSISW